MAIMLQRRPWVFLQKRPTLHLSNLEALPQVTSCSGLGEDTDAEQLQLPAWLPHLSPPRLHRRNNIILTRLIG